MRKYPAKRSRVKHMTKSWRVMTVCHFASTLRERPSCEVPTRHSIWQKDRLLYQILYPHYIYPHYPRIVRSAFQRENPSKYTLELRIVISTIIFTFHLDFPLLLPLHLYFLERFLAQTLTILNLSVEWSFGAVGKHWKELFSDGCNRVELQDPES